MSDTVSYNGKNYIKRRDQWENCEPGTDYQIWFELSEQWLSYNIYLEGDIVMHDGKKYRSKCWNENNIPGGVDLAWEPL